MLDLGGSTQRWREGLSMSAVDSEMSYPHTPCLLPIECYKDSLHLITHSPVVELHTEYSFRFILLHDQYNLYFYLHDQHIFIFN